MVKKCCNPLHKSKHSNVVTNLIFITSKRANEFHKFIGSFMCKPCSRAIYRQKKVDADDNVQDNKRTDPTYWCKAVQNQQRAEKINKLFSEEVTTKKISRKNGLKNAIKNAVVKLEEENDLRDDSLCPPQHIIDNFKEAFNENTRRSEKIEVLTTLPISWPIKMIRREFQVSRRMILCARKTREQLGFGAQPPVKKESLCVLLRRKK